MVFNHNINIVFVSMSLLQQQLTDKQPKETLKRMTEYSSSIPKEAPQKDNRAGSYTISCTDDVMSLLSSLSVSRH